jgi:hypothetical protein
VRPFDAKEDIMSNLFVAAVLVFGTLMATPTLAGVPKTISYQRRTYYLIQGETI